MAVMRPCPWCGASHRKKKTAKQCARAHGKTKPWTLAELGLK